MSFCVNEDWILNQLISHWYRSIYVSLTIDHIWWHNINYIYNYINWYDIDLSYYPAYTRLVTVLSWGVWADAHTVPAPCQIRQIAEKRKQVTSWQWTSRAKLKMINMKSSVRIYWVHFDSPQTSWVSKEIERVWLYVTWMLIESNMFFCYRYL